MIDEHEIERTSEIWSPLTVQFHDLYHPTPEGPNRLSHSTFDSTRKAILRNPSHLVYSDKPIFLLNFRQQHNMLTNTSQCRDDVYIHLEKGYFRTNREVSLIWVFIGMYLTVHDRNPSSFSNRGRAIHTPPHSFPSDETTANSLSDGKPSRFQAQLNLRHKST